MVRRTVREIHRRDIKMRHFLNRWFTLNSVRKGEVSFIEGSELHRTLWG